MQYHMGFISVNYGVNIYNIMYIYYMIPYEF